MDMVSSQDGKWWMVHDHESWQKNHHEMRIDPTTEFCNNKQEEFPSSRKKIKISLNFFCKLQHLCSVQLQWIKAIYYMGGLINADAEWASGVKRSEFFPRLE